jgi:predicted RNase H-like nuclease (RuvC/YqgF family)
MTVLDDNKCFIKKLISNLSSFIQVTVKDDLIKQNAIFKLGNVFKDISDYSEIYTKLENVLIDFVNKIQKINDEKDKEIEQLKERMNIYIKQIDTNIKSGQNNSEIQKLQKKIESQNVIMENTKNEIDSMKNSISKLNSLLRIDNTDSVLDVIKIQDMFKIYQEQVGKLSDKLENSEYIFLEDKKLRAKKLDLKDINTSRFLFREYFVNLTKFSKDMINYCTQSDN